MKFLVIQDAKLGDMVCTTPVFRAIKQKYPESFLTVSGNAINEELLRGNLYIDEYLKVTELPEKLKHQHFDVAILLGPNPQTLGRLIWSRIKTVIAPKITGGLSPYQTWKYRLLLLLVKAVEHRMGHYAPQEYLNMLLPCGISSTDTKKELFVTPEAERQMESKLAKFPGPKIALAPGAGNRIKEWPPEKFAVVADYLIKKYSAVVVVVGTDKDAPLRDNMLSGMKEKNILDTVGKLSIEELKALIKNMDLFIGADTGPIYVAEAFDIPTIDIVGPVDEREQPPQGPRHLVIVPKRTSPQLFVMNARHYDAQEARRQAEATSPQEVERAIDELLSPGLYNARTHNLGRHE